MRYKRMMLVIFFTTIAAVLTTCSTPAYAADDSLTIETANIVGDTLYIEVIDNATKVKSMLEFDLQDYPEDTEYITIQAVDWEGNTSDVARVKNPRYVPSTETSPQFPNVDITPPIGTTTTMPNGAFTPDGAGTVIDDIVNGSKEFFTITTDSKNTFYLVIDRQRNSENVYLLTAVTEDDLLDFIRNNGKKGVTPVTTTEAVTKLPVIPETVEEITETPQRSEQNNNNTMIIIIVAVVVVGGAAYYFKIYKPKQAKTSVDDDETDENPAEDDFDGGEGGDDIE